MCDGGREKRGVEVNDLALNIRTMSSREIAELTGKEHRNVMRDIRDMLEQLRASEGGLLNFERTYRDSQNKGNYIFDSLFLRFPQNTS